MIFEYLSLKLRNVPKNADLVLEPFSKEMSGILGDALQSLCVYGSVSAGDYIYGRSNINTVFLFKSLSVSDLKKISVPMEKWINRGFAPPIIFIEKDLERSLDTFPVLFMEIRDNHRVLFGKDPFRDLKIDPSFLRLQVEEKLKNKVAEARTEFLTSGESLSKFENMISQSFNSLFPLLRGLLHLSGVKPSIRKDVVVAEAEEKFDIERGVLVDALRHKMGVLRLSEKHNILAYYERYLCAVEKLADIADTIVVPQ